MKRKKIAFTGPFADVNFGDYGMLINNVYDIGVKDITLFSYDSTFLDLIRRDYLDDFNVEIREIKLCDTFELMITPGYIVTPVELLLMVENYEEISDSLEKVDILIVNGGGYFNQLWSMPHRIKRLIQIIIPILIANQLNKRIVFTGNSFGPFGKDSDFFAGIFNSLNQITLTCRDNLYSPMWLRQLGVKQELISYTPDDLLLINQSLGRKKRYFEVKAEKYIVMETYLSVTFLEQNLDKFCEFSKAMYDLHGLGIVFLPFNLEHGGINQGRFLQENLSNFEFVDISKLGYLPIQDAVSIIKQAELVICSRYHALVLAAGCQISTVSVLRDVIGDKRYYYNKNYGLLKELFKGNPINESDYMRMDYLEALSHVKNNYQKITNAQRKNFNNKYLENKEALSNTRKVFIQSIAAYFNN